jgi:hypothetical protein
MNHLCRPSPGYDPYANPPNYGNADEVVKENTNKVRKKGWITQIDLLTLPIPFSSASSLQVKNNQKLWDHKVKQLLKRDEENEENDDNQDDNPNDNERTWWSKWVGRKSALC